MKYYTIVSYKGNSLTGMELFGFTSIYLLRMEIKDLSGPLEGKKTKRKKITVALVVRLTDVAVINNARVRTLISRRACIS